MIQIKVCQWSSLMKSVIYVSLTVLLCSSCYLGKWYVYLDYRILYI